MLIQSMVEPDQKIKRELTIKINKFLPQAIPSRLQLPKLALAKVDDIGIRNDC